MCVRTIQIKDLHNYGTKKKITKEPPKNTHLKLLPIGLLAARKLHHPPARLQLPLDDATIFGCGDGVALVTGNGDTG